MTASTSRSPPRAPPARCRAAPAAAAPRCRARCCMRLEPDAIARLAARLERGSAVISATNGKTTTAAMVARHPRARAARGSSTTAPGRTWPAAWPPRCSTARATATPGLFEVDEFWLGQVVAELQPRALLLANLFRDQLDRYGELETIADRWAAVVGGHAGRARAQRRRPAGRRPRAATRRRRSTSASRTTRWRWPQMQHAADSKHCRRCGAPYVYDAIYLGHLGRYHCDNCGAARPEPAGRRPRHRAARACAARASRCARRRATRAIALPLPGLYNVYNALAAAALALALGAPLDRRRRRPARRLPRLRPRRDAARRRARAVDPAGQEPGRRQRGPAHARARARRARPARRAQRQHRRRPRRQLGLGRRLRGPRPPRAARDVQRHPRGRDGAAAEVRGRADRADRRRARAGRRRWTRALARRRRPLYALPTYTAMLELRELLVAPRRRARGRSRDRRVVWHDLECGGYDRRPAAVARARRPRAARRSSTSAPARAASRSTSPRRGHEVVALDLEPTLLDALRDRAAGLAVSTVVADARDVRPRPPLPARHRADADAAAARRRRGPRALPRCARARTWRPGGAARGRARRRARGLRRGARPAAAARHARGRRRGLREPAGRASATSAAARPSSASARSSRSTATRTTLRRRRRARPRRARGARGRGGARSACAPSRRGAIPQTLEYVGSTVVMLRG